MAEHPRSVARKRQKKKIAEKLRRWDEVVKERIAAARRSEMITAKDLSIVINARERIDG